MYIVMSVWLCEEEEGRGGGGEGQERDGGRAAPVGWSSSILTHTRCRLAGPCDPLDNGWEEGEEKEAVHSITKVAMILT